LSPRPQIDHIRKPQILAAAAEVIAERGIAATRIADVAERAGTSPPAILYWFDSKDDLFAEALTYEEERFSADVAERLRRLPDASSRLRVLIEESAAGSDWKLWMELWTHALRDGGARRARRELDVRWRATFAEIIREGQESGQFGEADSEEVAATLASLIDGLAVQATLEDPEMPVDRMCEVALATADTLLGCRLRDAAAEGGKAAAAEDAA
jgi:AcrR family transcriptional regulator